MKSKLTAEERHLRRLYMQRLRRRLDKNLDTRKYEKTHKGFLMRLYRNMQSRTTGVQVKKHHLYKNKSLLSRQEFYDWSLNNSSFLHLFNIWKSSNYDRKLTPTVDRINPEFGYETSNMRWITHSENSSLGGKRNIMLHPEVKKNLTSYRAPIAS